MVPGNSQKCSDVFFSRAAKCFPSAAFLNCRRLHKPRWQHPGESGRRGYHGVMNKEEGAMTKVSLWTTALWLSSLLSYHNILIFVFCFYRIQQGQEWVDSGVIWDAGSYPHPFLFLSTDLFQLQSWCRSKKTHYVTEIRRFNGRILKALGGPKGPKGALNLL